MARTLHTLNYLLQEAQGFLYLSVHPQHLLAVSADHGRVFEGILSQCGVETERIVLDVPEYAVAEKSHLLAAVRVWQERGYRIALDDFGCQHVQISRVLKLMPDYLKIAESLLSAAMLDVRKLKLLMKVVQKACAAGVTVIATGIETAQHLDFLRALNIDVAQGSLFGKPQPRCCRLGSLWADNA